LYPDGIKLRKKTPSLAGEGWGEENKIKKGHYLKSSLILTPSTLLRAGFSLKG